MRRGPGAACLARVQRAHWRLRRRLDDRAITPRRSEDLIILRVSFGFSCFPRDAAAASPGLCVNDPGVSSLRGARAPAKVRTGQDLGNYLIRHEQVATYAPTVGLWV